MRFLIDENLPDCLKIWSSDDFLHVNKILKSIPDNEIWKFALENNLIIITKDTDFHERILYRKPPPKVILIKLGNTSIKYLEDFFALHWKNIEEQINSVKLLVVFKNKIEGLR